MIIVLMGYMGSGKSTIGRQLAKELDYQFYDLDEVIEKVLERTIAELFEIKGSIFFRKEESAILQNTLNNNENIVLALGGGTPCYANNIEVIHKQQHTVSIYLKWPLKTLVKRLKEEKEHRPLIRNVADDELEEFIGKHLFERNYYYDQADHILVCEGKSIGQIIEEIIGLCKENGKFLTG